MAVLLRAVCEELIGMFCLVQTQEGGRAGVGKRYEGVGVGEGEGFEEAGKLADGDNELVVVVYWYQTEHSEVRRLELGLSICCGEYVRLLLC